MKVEVFPSELKGATEAPGSKSIAQRMVACALLAKGESVIKNFPDSRDCTASLNIAQALGAVIVKKGNEVSIRGGYPHSFQAEIRNPKSEINCGESGLSARMFASIAALHNEPIVLTGAGSLLNRPFDELQKTLVPLTNECSTNDGKLPLKILGPLRGGSITVDGSVSSQFLTGLLIALPKATAHSTIKALALKSIPYANMTLQVVRIFGIEITNENFKTFHIKGGQSYQSRHLHVGGDWSGASFLLVAAALCSEEGVVIENLNSEFDQADAAILDVFKKSGVRYEERENSVFVKKSVIKAFEFDATHCPDLFPPLVALASFADGISTIHGVHRLKHKESNRGKVLQEEFAKANIRIVIRNDDMIVYPGHISPSEINSHNDHRIAMAGAILGLAGAKTTIKGAECISKSFPGFFHELKKLGANISER